MTAPGELSRRWAVAIVGVPIVLVLLYFGNWILGAPVALLAALGAAEAYRLAARKGVEAFRWVGATGAAALVIGATWRPTFTGFSPWALAAVATVTLVAVVLAIAGRGPEGQPLSAVSVTLFGCVYVGLPLAFVPLIHALPAVDSWGEVVPKPWLGTAVVALPLASAWVGDAAAFFAGTKWGRSKIAPSISPNKSWVGSWSGLAGAAVAAALWYYLAAPYLPGMPIESLWVAAVVGAVLGVGAQVGDLVISLLKREAGVKDTGALFPGHGGVLDRLDALTFTLPSTYAVFVILARIA